MTKVQNKHGAYDVSDALATGIARVVREVADLATSLGGYGAPVVGVTLDGREHRGSLVSGATPDQGPYVQDAEGRRWRCSSLRSAGDDRSKADGTT